MMPDQEDYITEFDEAFDSTPTKDKKSFKFGWSNKKILKSVATVFILILCAVLAYVFFPQINLSDSFTANDSSKDSFELKFSASQTIQINEIVAAQVAVERVKIKNELVFELTQKINEIIKDEILSKVSGDSVDVGLIIDERIGVALGSINQELLDRKAALRGLSDTVADNTSLYRKIKQAQFSATNDLKALASKVAKHSHNKVKANQNAITVSSGWVFKSANDEFGWIVNSLDGRPLKVVLGTEVPSFGAVISIDAEKKQVVTTFGLILPYSAGEHRSGASRTDG